MKIEKTCTKETVRYETVGSESVFLKRNISQDGRVTKEKLIEVNNVRELRTNRIKTVKDAFEYFVEYKEFKHMQRPCK